jgi:hypothetical protein
MDEISFLGYNSILIGAFSYVIVIKIICRKDGNMMRLLILIAITLIVSLTPISGITNASEQNNIKVYIEDEELPMTQPPIIKDNRTLVPLRSIFEALETPVNWDGETKTIQTFKYPYNIFIKIGADQAKVIDIRTEEVFKTLSLDVPAQIIDGRTYVPLRFVSETLGAKVKWDPTTRSIQITIYELMSNDFYLLKHDGSKQELTYNSFLYNDQHDNIPGKEIVQVTMLKQLVHERIEVYTYHKGIASDGNAIQMSTQGFRTNDGEKQDGYYQLNHIQETYIEGRYTTYRNNNFSFTITDALTNVANLRDSNDAFIEKVE